MKARRNYKDSVFRDLFGSPERKEYTLSLYNALAGTGYADPDLVELRSIDDAIYISYKNDVSFVIGDELVLWEHQSTFNPNMPYRGFQYFARLYSRLIQEMDVDPFGTAALELPTPRYFVFYIGRRARPEREVLRLSSLFSAGGGSIEVEATVINIGEGMNAELKARCEALAGYARFVEYTNFYRYEMEMELEDAIESSMKRCIAEGILADYLIARRAEVIDMMLFDYTEDEYRALARRSAIREGLAEGREKGLAEGREKGLAEGREKGLAEGREKGLAEGLAEGRAAERASMLERVARMVASGEVSSDAVIAGLGFTGEELEIALGALRVSE